MNETLGPEIRETGLLLKSEPAADVKWIAFGINASSVSNKQERSEHSFPNFLFR